MELTVLGKFGPYPAKDRRSACSGYLVTEGNASILLDMGPGVLNKLQRTIDIESLDAIFISHLHFDHTSDLLPFRYLLDSLNKDITVFTRYEDSDWYRTLFTHPHINVINVIPNDTVEFKGLEMTFYDMTHPVPSMGVLIKGGANLFYTGDTTFNNNVIEGCENADLMLGDCSCPPGANKAHMTTENAKYINQRTGVKIIATHFSPEYDPEGDFEGYPDIQVAHQGRKYSI